MRLAYLVAAGGIPVQGPTGASGHVRELVQALRRTGPCALYAAVEADHRGRFGPPVPATITGTPGWPSWLAPWRELREVRAARALARRVLEDAHGAPVPPGRPTRENGPPYDLLIERHSLFSDASWRVGARLGIPWILEVNAPHVRERQRFEELRQPALARRWERQVLQAAPCIVTVSPWLRRWLVDTVGCRPERVHWLPNGVPPWVGDRARGRARLGLAADDPVIGFLGSNRPWHGADQLPALARAVGAHLVLIGGFPSPSPAAEGAAGPGPRVLRPGFLHGQALADVLAALDVGLAPYPADAPPWFCPLKLFHYRAQGTPVVATDVGALSELVAGGGSVVPPDEPRALAAAVKHWLGAPRPPRRVRSWDSVARELRTLGAALPRRAPPAPRGLWAPGL